MRGKQGADRTARRGCSTWGIKDGIDVALKSFGGALSVQRPSLEHVTFLHHLLETVALEPHFQKSSNVDKVQSVQYAACHTRPGVAQAK
jgi:hypothetical protein